MYSLEGTQSLEEKIEDSLVMWHEEKTSSELVKIIKYRDVEKRHNSSLHSAQHVLMVIIRFYPWDMITKICVHSIPFFLTRKRLLA